MQRTFFLVTAGRLDEANTALERRVARKPNDVEALRLLGKLRFQQGQPVTAVAALTRAVRLAPRLPELHFELATALLAAGRPDQAIAAFRQELTIQPAHAGTLFNLAWTLRQTGGSEPAEELLNRLVRWYPDHIAGWYNLGNLRLDRNDLEGAIQAFTVLLAITPHHPPALTNLGLAWQRLGHLDQAMVAFRQALTIDPSLVTAANNLGNALTSMGRAAEALPLFWRILSQQPDDATTLYNLALALRELDRLDDAAAALERVVAAAPAMADAWNSLGVVYLEREDLTRAESALNRALRLRPECVEALNNLGTVLAAQTRTQEAASLYRRALTLEPFNAAVHSNLLFLLLHMFGPSAEEVFAEHRRYGERQEGRVAVAPWPPPAPAETERRLRIGYVSPDFCEHAVNLFFEPVLRHHDHVRFEVFCYHTSLRTDETTARLRAAADHWRPVAHLPPDRAAALIRQDRIDILVDMAGHTRNNGLQIFVHKPAPIQATWLGYPGTTGLSRIDYRITDDTTDPPGEAERLYTERLARLPFSAVLQPPPDCPEVSPPPVLARGRPRFGSFNKPQKINDAVIAAWSRILTELPDAELVMVVPGGDQTDIRDLFRHLFSGHGVKPERVQVVGRCGLAGFLRLVAEVDIALDTFPYCGSTTTFLSLWMGVPTIALTGDNAAAKVTAGMMEVCELGDLTATEVDGYVRAACTLARNPTRLNQLRPLLRRRIAESSLMLAATFTCCLEAEYRIWWRRFVDPAGTATARTIRLPDDLAAELEVCQVLDPPFVPQGGFGWLIRNITLTEDDVFSHYDRSRLVLLENGRPLGHPHARHITIKQRGKGRFSHWERFLYFSASDNSDPNTNGYQYVIGRLRPQAPAATSSSAQVVANDGDSDTTLVAFYDLVNIAMITYEFVWFLADADLERRRLGLSRGRVVILSPPDNITDEAPEYDRVIDAERRQRRLSELLLPLVDMFPHWNGALVSSRQEALALVRRSPHLFPADYHPFAPPLVNAHSPRRVIAAAVAGLPVATATAPADAVRRVSAWLACQAGLSEPRPPGAPAKRVISITIRDYGFRPEQNSNLPAWLAFAAGLDPERYLPVFIPDAETPFPVETVLRTGVVFNEAAKDPRLRAAICQLSFLNLGIYHGPMTLCCFNPDCSFLVFKMINEAVNEASTGFFEWRGLPTHCDWPFLGPTQHLVWEPDNEPTIRREFDRMVRRLEATGRE